MSADAGPRPMEAPDLNKPHTASAEAHSIPPPFQRGPSLPPASPSQLEMGLGGNRGRGWPSLHVLCGAIAALWGAAIILAKLVTVGGWSIHDQGNEAYRFGMNFAVLIGAALLVAGVFHLRRGVRRYRDLPVASVTTRNRLVNLGLTIALFVLTLLAAPFVPDPDGRFENPQAPYSYRYPGTWAEDDPGGPARAYYWLANLSIVGRPDNDAGVIVATYPGRQTVSLRAGFERMIEEQGGRVTELRSTTMTGQPADFFAYDMPAGRHDGSMTIAHRSDADYVIWCQWENDPPSAREGCDKVRETLQVE
jgi:hypothetical protein